MTIWLALQILFDVTLIVSTIHVIRRGGPVEKAGIATVILGSGLSVGVGSLAGASWMDRRSSLLAVDLIVLFIFFWLALSTRRFWPIWASGFQLIGVVTDVAALLGTSRIVHAYAILSGVWVYPILGSIVFGCRHNVRSALIDG